jgi:HNH endonuclease
MARKFACYLSSMQGDLFRKLGGLSDAALLDGLVRVTRSGRRLLAELLAHLCEVESRRLHLDMGYPSLFAYCVARLGFSEGEAYLRIEVARLARRAPVVFTLIEEGRLSLSAAALLKPHLLAPNLAELVDAVAGKTVQAAREALVSFFPQPEVASSIRKLPVPACESIRAAHSLFDEGVALVTPVGAAASTSSGGNSDSSLLRSRSADSEAAYESRALKLEVPPETANGSASEAAPHTWPQASRRPNARRCFEPLSPDRYKVQFTADAELKRKLELARDLLRHALPSGDLSAIIDRALEVLIASELKRRFGAGARRKACGTRPQKSTGGAEAVRRESAPPPNVRARPSGPTGQTPSGSNEQPSPRITRATRRAVLERDGLRCTWRGPDGARCTSRAWLEGDHIHPRALGGDSEINNVRFLCRSHNRRAAELVYGEPHVNRAIQRRRSQDTPASPSPRDASITGAERTTKVPQCCEH